MRILALLLLAGCITSSQATITLHGTTFAYEAPGTLEVVQVGRLAQWEDVSFSAEPAVEFTGDFDGTMGTPGPIAEGPIKAGQSFALCTTGRGPVSLGIHSGMGTTTVAVPVEDC